MANDSLTPGRDDKPDLSNDIVLYLEELSVSFDGFKALDNLTLYLNAGELRCIIGPNGAGKTTLMDVITGRIRPDEGSAYFGRGARGRGVDLCQHDESEIACLGIGRKFQRPTVFEQHTVFENIELALSGGRNLFQVLTAKLSRHDREKIEDVLESTRLLEVQDQPAGALSHGQKQWLEIGMLVAQDPILLLIDEPVAGMTPQEVELTGELFRELAGDRSVVVIEHDMEFVESIADTVSVLHQGQLLVEGSYDAVSQDQRVQQVYLDH